MRYILFKAKKQTSKIWHFGDYWYNGFCQEHNLKCLTEGGTQFEDVKIDTNTLCQFTGLLDKNGKKIFEGDILNDLIVKYTEGCFFLGENPLSLSNSHREDRIILFKGKRVDNNEWVEGFYAESKDESISVIFNEDFDWDVIKETVCQFTGILDDNLDKLFEGDICESTYINTPLAYAKKNPPDTVLNQRVEFYKGGFSLINLEDFDDDFSKRMRNHTQLYYTESTLTIKIIGNIHDK